MSSFCNVTCAESCGTWSCGGKCKTSDDCGLASKDYVCCDGHCYRIDFCPTCCRDLCDFKGECAECWTKFNCDSGYTCIGSKCVKSIAHRDLGLMIGLGIALVLTIVLIKLSWKYYRKCTRQQTSRNNASNNIEMVTQGTQQSTVSSYHLAQDMPPESSFTSTLPPSYSEARLSSNHLHENVYGNDAPPSYEEVVNSPQTFNRPSGRGEEMPAIT